MGSCFLHGQNDGTGGSLDLKIVGGTTTPSNPKNNLIWVKTDVPIQRWIMSRSTTAWSDLAGTICITYDSDNTFSLGTRSSLVFNKKLHGLYGQMWIYLTGCLQTDGTGYKPVDAYIYKDAVNSWVQFSSNRTYLFNSGDICSALTGGWTSDGYRQISEYPSGGGVVESSVLTATGKKDTYNGCIGTENAVNMTGYRTLYFDCSSTSDVNKAIYISTSKMNFQDNQAAARQLESDRTVLSLDISNLNGSYYVCFTAAAAGGTTTVYNVWME